MLVVLVYSSEYLQIDSDTIIAWRAISLPGFNDLCCMVSTWYNIGLSIWRHQSDYLHILLIFQTWIHLSFELMQIFAEGDQQQF